MPKPFIRLPSKRNYDTQKQRSQLGAFAIEYVKQNSLLRHPFYIKWSQGKLTKNDLARYSEQYYFIEKNLPVFLTKAIKSSKSSCLRQLLTKNLNDESAFPRAHAEIFKGFRNAVGGRVNATISPATRGLVSAQNDSATSSASKALGVLSFYELQSSEVAQSKAQGLLERYKMESSQIEFWALHSEIDGLHKDWILQAIALSGIERTEFINGLIVGRKIWNYFLDERDELTAA